MWENLKSLRLAKRKIFWVLVLVEAALLLAAVSGLFGKDGVYRFDGTAMTLLQGSRDPESGAVSIDESYDHKGKIAVFQGIRLGPGVYRVSLEYQTDTDFLNHCDIRDNSVRYKNLLSNGDTLYAGLNSTDFDMWLKGDTDQIEVSVSYGGQGSLTVKGLKIYETNAMARIGIFLILALSLLVDACWLLVQYNRQFPIPAKTRNIAFGLLATVVMAAYPLGVDTMSPGGGSGLPSEPCGRDKGRSSGRSVSCEDRSRVAAWVWVCLLHLLRGYRTGATGHVPADRFYRDDQLPAVSACADCGHGACVLLLFPENIQGALYWPVVQHALFPFRLPHVQDILRRGLR